MTYYDTIACGYDTLHRDEQIAKLAVISQYFRPQPTDKLLDIGCGSGISTRYWQCNRTGVDPSKKLLTIAKKNDQKGSYIQSSAEALPFPDKFFDHIICITAIHHTDVPKALQEMKRVGKNSFVITVLNKSARAKKIETLIYATFPAITKIALKVDTLYFS